MNTKFLMVLMVTTSLMSAISTQCFCITDKNACCPAADTKESKRNNRKPDKPTADNTSNITLVPFGYDNRLITLKVAMMSPEDEHEFILDSGAPTFLTDSITKEHDMDPVNSEIAYDVNRNEQKIDFYNIRNMAIGGSKIKNTMAASSKKVSEMPLLKGRTYSGLLGANAMMNKIWMINYNCQEIAITENTENIPIPDTAFSTKMKLDEWGRPIIKVAVGNDQYINFIVDVGYNGSLLLPKKYLSKPLFNDSLSYSENEKLSSGFESKEVQMNYHFLQSVSIGDMKLENVKASTSGNNMDALIGNEFLDDYIVILDFINNRLTFLPADKSCNSNCC